MIPSLSRRSQSGSGRFAWEQKVPLRRDELLSSNFGGGKAASARVPLAPVFVHPIESFGEVSLNFANSWFPWTPLPRVGIVPGSFATEAANPSTHGVTMISNKCTVIAIVALFPLAMAGLACSSSEQAAPSAQVDDAGPQSDPGDASGDAGAVQPADSGQGPTVYAEVWTDPATSLMWQNSRFGSKMVWQSAQDFCKGMNFGGFTDWTAPSGTDLEALGEGCTDRNGCAGGAGPAKGCYWHPELTGTCGEYWTSGWVSINGGAGRIEYVDFTTTPFTKQISEADGRTAYVRCVRGKKK